MNIFVLDRKSARNNKLDTQICETGDVCVVIECASRLCIDWMYESIEIIVDCPFMIKSSGQKHESFVKFLPDQLDSLRHTT